MPKNVIIWMSDVCFPGNFFFKILFDMEQEKATGKEREETLN